MPDAPKSFPDVIGLWGSRADMASDIGATTEAVRKWEERKLIPAEWWLAILETATAQKAGLTAEMLVGLRAKPAPVDPEPEGCRA